MTPYRRADKREAYCEVAQSGTPLRQLQDSTLLFSGSQIQVNGYLTYVVKKVPQRPVHRSGIVN